MIRAIDTAMNGKLDVNDMTAIKYDMKIIPNLKLWLIY